MLSSTTTILVTILAATDAVCIPDRDPCANPRHQVLYERRAKYPQFGIPWASEMVLDGVTEAGRKQVQRALEALATGSKRSSRKAARRSASS